MRKQIIFFSSILISVLLVSCTIQEDYTFNKDFSGHYSFQFDYSALLSYSDDDSSANELSKGYSGMEKELKKVDGINNIIIITDDEKGKVLVSYDFASLKALNATNYNNESERYNKYFTLDGKILSVTIDFTDELEEYKDPEMDETELLENIEEFVDYSMTFTFDKKIKAIELNNFTQKDANTLLFELNKENVLQPSSFKIKLH
jgi:hypothetical protein